MITDIRFFSNYNNTAYLRDITIGIRVERQIYCEMGRTWISINTYFK